MFKSMKDANNTLTVIKNRDNLFKPSKKILALKNKVEKQIAAMNTKFTLTDDEGNPAYKPEEQVADLEKAQADAAEFTKQYAEAAYDFALKSKDPVLTMAKIAMLPKMSVAINAKDDGDMLEASGSVKENLFDFKAFKDYADKENKRFGDESYKSKLTTLYGDVVTAALQTLYLDASDASGDNDDAKLAIVKKYAATLDTSEWKAVQNLNTLRSRKVELALLRSLVDALVGEGKIALKKKHVAWLENVVVSKGKNVFSLSIVKRDTLLKLVTEIIVAVVNDLDLEISY